MYWNLNVIALQFNCHQLGNAKSRIMLSETDCLQVGVGGWGCWWNRARPLSSCVFCIFRGNLWPFLDFVVMFEEINCKYFAMVRTPVTLIASPPSFLPGSAI